MTGSSTCGPGGSTAATVNLDPLTPDQLTRHLAAWFEQTATEEYRRLMVPMLRELATARPVAPARLAALTGLPADRVEALLRQASAEWDPSGQRLIGLGLTSVPTQHRYQVDGHRLWAWCARDPLVFPVWLGARPRRVAVRCHRRPRPSRGDPRRGAARRAGLRAQHPDGLVLPVAEGFEVLRAAITQAWGIRAWSACSVARRPTRSRAAESARCCRTPACRRARRWPSSST